MHLFIRSIRYFLALSLALSVSIVLSSLILSSQVTIVSAWRVVFVMQTLFSSTNVHDQCARDVYLINCKFVLWTNLLNITCDRVRDKKDTRDAMQCYKVNASFLHFIENVSLLSLSLSLPVTGDLAFSRCSDGSLTRGACICVDIEERKVSCHLISIQPFCSTLWLTLFLSLSLCVLHSLTRSLAYTRIINKTLAEFPVIHSGSVRMLRVDVW